MTAPHEDPHGEREGGSPADPPGTRSIRLEVEVPGTPEQVWAAIATGPGITAWFVPAEVGGEVGGAVTLDFGPGMGAETGRVTAFEPHRRFRYEAPLEGERRLAYEWLVEARDGGTCVVRLVNSGFGTGEDWDGDYDGMTGGWRLFLDNLRLYLTHFPGQTCSSIIVNGATNGPRATALRAMVDALGLPELAVGQPAAGSAPGAPPLAGRVERLTEDMVTLRLDRPAPGILFLAAEGSDEQVWTSVYGYFFGPGAAAAVARHEPGWRSWLATTFPPTASAPSTS